MFRLFRKKLPHCDDLFAKYLSPWYPDENHGNMTRPDMYVISGYNGHPIDFDTVQYLSAGQLLKEKNQIAKMADAALGDYQHILSANELTLDVLDAVDKFYDREKIGKLIKSSDPKDFSNDYLISVCEFGAMLGKLFNDEEEFGWLYSTPYFNSIIVHKNTGFGIPVFDWAVKKFSEYGVDDGFVAKFHAAIAGIREQELQNT